LRFENVCVFADVRILLDLKGIRGDVLAILERKPRENIEWAVGWLEVLKWLVFRLL
jgi:hypothetical protein